MKIKVISRSLDDHLPSSSEAAHPIQRNLAPHLHPFSKPREYTRALTAAKIDRIFAKPFVDALGGHQDGVYVLGKDSRRVSVVAGGGGDGEVIVHSLNLRKSLYTLQAHKGMVGGLCWNSEARDDKRKLITCGKLDGVIKIWQGEQLETTIQSKNGINGLDHHRTDPTYATASNSVQIWDENRSTPVSNLVFGSSMETVAAVRFNQSETSVLASVGNDRTMCLYDIRTGKAERRVMMQMRSNTLSWCPTLPTVLLMASEDHNLYTFDIRNLESPTQIYKGHVGGVMGCDWSPTGEEFVSGSYDRTIRIWNRDAGKSRDVYHTKRMQRVFDVTFTPTADFILSASDDGNVRIWKSNASAKLGPVSSKEKQSIDYRQKLIDKWSAESQVRAVKERRHVPASVHSTVQKKRTMLEALKVKEDRRRKHTRAGKEKPKAERKKAVVVEQK